MINRVTRNVSASLPLKSCNLVNPVPKHQRSEFRAPLLSRPRVPRVGSGAGDQFSGKGAADKVGAISLGYFAFF
jgi:hypothetical protein